MSEGRSTDAAATNGAAGPSATLPWADRSDAALVADLARGCQEAMAELYRRHAGRMFALSRRVLDDDERAGEVVADAFVAVWDRPEAYNPRHGTVLAHLLADTRRRSLGALSSLPGGAPNRPPGRGGDPNPARPGGPSTVQSLPADQREVLELAYFSGLTCRDLAAQLGVPEDTVREQMALGLDHLRAGRASGLRRTPGG